MSTGCINVTEENTQNETSVPLVLDVVSGENSDDLSGVPQVVQAQSGGLRITVEGADDNLVIFQEGSRIETISGSKMVMIRVPAHSETHLRFELWNPFGGPAKVRVELSPVSPSYAVKADGITVPNVAFPVAQWSVKVVNRGA